MLEQIHCTIVLIHASTDREENDQCVIMDNWKYKTNGNYIVNIKYLFNFKTVTVEQFHFFGWKKMILHS